LRRSPQQQAKLVALRGRAHYSSLRAGWRHPARWSSFAGLLLGGQLRPPGGTGDCAFVLACAYGAPPPEPANLHGAPSSVVYSIAAVGNRSGIGRPQPRRGFVSGGGHLGRATAPGEARDGRRCHPAAVAVAARRTRGRGDRGRGQHVDAPRSEDHLGRPTERPPSRSVSRVAHRLTEVFLVRHGNGG